MPGRAAGELVSFEQDNVFPTHEGQVVGDAAPTHTATDDDNLSL
jgi:hypothetical protein